MCDRRQNRILFFAPRLDLEGGIANFYRMLKPHFPGEWQIFEKSQAKSLPGKLLATGYDLLRFSWKLAFGGYSTVCLNPSLKPLVVKREAVYAFIAKKIFRKKLVIFWHGWEVDYAAQIEKQLLPKFSRQYFSADKMLVLIPELCNTLERWGYRNPVKLITTCFEDSYSDLDRKFSTQPPFRILLLARLEVYKGVFIALEALQIIRKQCSIPVTLTLAGDGSAAEEVRQYIDRHGLQDVDLPGYVRGELKQQCFLEHDIFIQPSFSEGLPVSMLEAMVCGLPVITSAVGGIPAFFEEGRMGHMLDSLKPEDYAQAVIKLLQQPELLEKIGSYNQTYARQRFTASAVTDRLSRELSEL